MLPYRDGWLTRIALGAFFLLIIGYAYFEAQGLLFGPSISVTSDVTEVHEPLITLQGQADRISSLTLNGNPVQVTEAGAFAEPYLLSSGYNRLVLEASDKYGRKRAETIEIVFTPPETAASSSFATTTEMTATSTGATTTTP